MPSKPDSRELERCIGQDAFKIGSGGLGGSVCVICYVWLAFYVLAVTHSLLSQRAALPTTTAEAQEPLHASPFRTVPLTVDGREAAIDALVLSMLAWITTSTGLTVSEPPRIAFAPDSHFQQQLHSEAAQATPEATTPNNQKTLATEKFFSVQGFYLRATATVYLPETWQLAALRDQSTLLHELVHHAQRLNKVGVACPGQLERQAYDLQVEWLREQGVAQPFDLIGIDEFTMLILTACPPSDG